MSLAAPAPATVVETGRSMVSCRGIGHHQAAHPLLALVAASQLVGVVAGALISKRLRAGYPRQRCTKPFSQAHYPGPCQPLAGCKVTRNQQRLGVGGLALAHRPMSLERRSCCRPHRIRHHHIGALGQRSRQDGGCLGQSRLCTSRRNRRKRCAVANRSRHLDVLADLYLRHYRCRRLWRCRGSRCIFCTNCRHRRRHSQLSCNHRLGRRAAHACRDQQQHSRLWCKRCRVGRRRHQHAEHLLRNLQRADKQRGRRLCIDLDTLLHRQLWRPNHLACPCLVARAACQQTRLDTLHIGCPTVHARRHLGRLHLHARQLARVAYVLG